MNLKDIQQVETANIQDWNKALSNMWTEEVLEKRGYEPMFDLLKASFNMMITPIALDTLSGKTIISNAFHLLTDLVIALATILEVLNKTYIFFASLFTGNFRQAFLNFPKILFIPLVMSIYISLDLLITAASFVTRPIATLAYLAAVLGSFCFGADETKAHAHSSVLA